MKIGYNLTIYEKMPNLKSINSFKKSPRSVPRVYLFVILICNLTHLQLKRRGYKGKIHVKNIRKNKCKIRNYLKSRIRIRKKSFRIHNTKKTFDLDPKCMDIR
jgi:hypothetical protein